jgi:hypothetical protein
MPDSIYPGAETYLITDRDNDLIKGIHTSAVAPTHARPWLPDKKLHACLIICQVKVGEATGHDGARVGGSHWPQQGKIRLDRASIPPYPRAPGNSRGEARPTALTTRKT